MRWLDHMTRSLVWRPTGLLPSLAQLEPEHGRVAKWEVTPERGGPSLIVAELADAKVVGDLRLVATQEDVVIGGVQSIFDTADPTNHYALKRRRFRLPHYRRGTARLLGVSNGDNYYHWLLDTLPRWHLLQLAGITAYDFVLLPARPAPFQEETLDRLQIPASRRLRCSKNVVHQFERLVVPAMPFPVEEVAPWACDWVRSLFPEKATGPEKLYLSRRTGRRRLVNEAELEQALNAQGFAIVDICGMSVAEQARLLGNARCVVAPHGAVLTNLLFAPAGARVVELFHPEHKNRCYVNLAAACGHHYASLDGLATNRPGAELLEYQVKVDRVLELVGQGE
jgi:hypothetical protein